MSGILGGGGGGQTISNSETPLSSFNVQTSVRGTPVPIVYGRTRVPVNLIWYGDFTAIPHTVTSSSGGGGGKGGGGGEVNTTTTTYTYTTSVLMGIGEGPITGIHAFWNDKDYSDNADVFTKYLGTYAQAAWSYLVTNHPTEALAYRGEAYVAAAAYDLKTGSSLGNHSFDVTGILPYNAGTIDGANPKEILTDFLTNTHYGALFPSSYLGTWGQFSDYCVASGIFLSPIYDQAMEARQAITDLMQLTNSGIFFSEGELKIVPFGDTAITGNGVTYTPSVTVAYDLTDDDFLDKSEPIRMMRTPNADAYNQVQLEFRDSANQYNIGVMVAQDQASVETYGLKPLDMITAHSITDATTARLVAQLIMQRQLYTRNIYEFTIGLKYARLEPCDYLTLTDSRMGFSQIPVRILSIEEDDTGQLRIQAEDAPSGILYSPYYEAPTGGGYTVNYGVDPGMVVAPKFFEMPAQKVLGGLAVGVAVTGSSSDWGGCEVWVSNDGSNYALLDKLYGGARYGTITTTITSAAGQVVRASLVGLGGQMVSGSATDATNLTTLCAIEGEFVAHTTAALISANTYDLTLASRGGYSTLPAAHTAGAQFIRVDRGIAYSEELDLTYIGKTLYFKFLSFNKYGGGKQALADVVEYTYTVAGTMAQLAPATVSSLSATAGQNTIFLQWTNPSDMTWVREIEVWRNTTNDSGTATRIGSVTGAVGFYADTVGATGLTRYYWIRTINKQGYPSSFSSVASATSGTVVPGSGAILAGMLAADSVVAANIDVADLSAVSATIGVLRTASTGARMEIRDNVIKVYDSSGTLRVKIGDLSL